VEALAPSFDSISTAADPVCRLRVASISGSVHESQRLQSFT
jgi:hypothetical protein